MGEWAATACQKYQSNGAAKHLKGEIGEKLSVKALASEFGCSTKTIQRDINERLPMLRKYLGVEFEPTRVGKLIA